MDKESCVERQASLTALGPAFQGFFLNPPSGRPWKANDAMGFLTFLWPRGQRML